MKCALEQLSAWEEFPTKIVDVVVNLSDNKTSTHQIVFSHVLVAERERFMQFRNVEMSDGNESAQRESFLEKVLILESTHCYTH